VLHYELENFDFLEYVIKSTNRYLSKQERDFEIENVCIKHIKKLSKTMHSTERMIIFEKMRDDLDELLKDRNEQVVLEYFNITAWVTSKIYKISFAEAVMNELKADKIA
jgi:hypothetical protein